MASHNLRRKGTGMICRELNVNFTAFIICMALVKILHVTYLSFFFYKMGYVMPAKVRIFTTCEYTL